MVTLKVPVVGSSQPWAAWTSTEFFLILSGTCLLIVAAELQSVNNLGVPTLEALSFPA